MRVPVIATKGGIIFLREQEVRPSAAKILEGIVTPIDWDTGSAIF